MITPAATAEVSATPNSMQIENRKLPRKLSQNSSLRSRARQRCLAGARAQPAEHRDRSDAEAQPGKQEDREHGDQQLREADIAAHERHARGKAEVGPPRRVRRGMAGGSPAGPVIAPRRRAARLRRMSMASSKIASCDRERKQEAQHVAR